MHCCPIRHFNQCKINGSVDQEYSVFLDLMVFQKNFDKNKIKNTGSKW